MANEEPSKELSFWATVQYNRRYTVPPIICELAKIKAGKKVLFRVEAVKEA